MNIKRNKFKLAAFVCSLFMLTGCSSVTKTVDLDNGSSVNIATVKAITSTTDTQLDPGVEVVSSWDKENSNFIELNGDSIKFNGVGASVNKNIISISKSGTYVISGKLNDGQIIVEESSKGTVHLVFNGAEINNSSSSPVFIKKAGMVVITLEKGTENIVTDGKDYIFADSNETEPDAAIFSKDDLYINGEGTLIVNANYNDGIKSKDNLEIISGNITVNSVDDGIVGKDKVDILGGNIEIAAGDDGIHAETTLNIQDGTINITKSEEGLEGSLITITGGKINILANDDGINASSGDGGSDNKIIISGGYTVVNASGDGVDSNGSIEMTGGTLIVYGPTNNGNGALDYDTTFEMSGGLLIAAGSRGMVQTPSQESSQYSINMIYSTIQKAGKAVQLLDSSGNIIATFEPEKQYQSVVISSPELTKGQTYTISTDGNKTVEFTLNDVVTWVSESGIIENGGMRQGGMKPGGMKPGGAKPNFEPRENLPTVENK